MTSKNQNTVTLTMCHVIISRHFFSCSVVNFFIHFKMLSYIIYLNEWKNCFDFLSEPFSSAVLLDFSTEELRLVVKLSPDRLFVRQIIRDPLTSHFQLEFNLSWFDNIELVVDFYHGNYLYDWIGSTVTRLKLMRAVYNQVLSLQYLAGVAVNKNQLFIPNPHLQNVVSSRPKYFLLEIFKGNFYSTPFLFSTI